MRQAAKWHCKPRRIPGGRPVLAGLALSAVGLAVSAYLAAASGTGPATPTAPTETASAGLATVSVPFCGPGSACQAVWASPYSQLFGWNLPAWGLLAYAALTVGGLLWAVGLGHRGRLLRSGVVALSWAVAGFSAYLIVLQWAVLRALCPWCLAADTAGVLAAAAYTVAAPRDGMEVRGQPGVTARQRGARKQGRQNNASAQALAQWAYARLAVALPVIAGAAAAVTLAVTHWVSAGHATQAQQLVSLPTGLAITSLPERLQHLEALMAAGPSDAPVRVDVYADFQCPYCARAAREVIAPLMAQDVAEGRMRIVFHNFAFLGAESRWAAEAAVCAAAQGRFWPFHDRLFAEHRGENVGTFRPERLVAMARDEGLGVEAFQRCLEQRSARSLVEASYEEGRRRGVRATPTFIVNGRLVEGLVPVEVIRQLAYGGGQ